jgi:hypothetical protein
VALAELVGRTLDPLGARRGFATADLMAGWADIVGARYADCSLPEKIVWPRGAANEGGGGTLVVRIEGGRALLFQHEVGQIVERLNAVAGYGSIARIKIVQGPVGSRRRPAPAEPAAFLDAQAESRLAEALGSVESDNLRNALDRLGRAVLGRRDKKS